MNQSLRSIVAISVLALAGQSFAAEGDKPAANPAPAQRTIVVNPGGAGGGVGAWGWNGVTQPNVMMLVYVLSELNLTPDFTLTPEQKFKIQAIRDEVKAEQDKWRADHADDFKAFQEQMSKLRGAPDAAEKWKEISAAQAALYQTAPKENDAVDKIKALLTTDQLKQLTAKEADNKTRSERAMKEAQERIKNVLPAGGAQLERKNPQ